jgi:putative oxidoreductase
MVCQGLSLRRLYSTFAAGWPGVGLLLLRVIVGSALVARTPSALLNFSPTITSKTLLCLATCGLLLISGFWTPIAGVLVAVIEIYEIYAQSENRWEHVLVATISGALAMLGPGLWSVDARLFGWKRVEAPPRKK